MVYMAETILLVHDVFAKLTGFDPELLLETLGDVATIADSAELLGLMDVLPEEQRDPMRNFLASIPPAVDAAIVAAVRSALARGLRAAISWQPGYAFEVRIWDVSFESHGLVNIHLVSPHPVEAEPSS